MATRALQQVVTYVAWDTSANAMKTGDSANHSTSWEKDGTRSATTNATAEVDATNLPGLYKVTMTSTETDCIQGVLGGKSSTANIVLIPTMVAFDYLNTGAPAAAGVPDVNIKNMNNVAATSITTINANQGTTQPINFTGTAGSALAKSDMVDVAGAAVSTTSAQIGVNAVNIGGTAQTGRDIGASVLLSAGTGTGQLDFTSGVVKANATQLLGGTIPTPNVTGVPLVDLKYTLGTISPAAAGSVAIDWGQISNKGAAVNLSATQIQSVNNLAAGSDSINTIATSGSTLTTGSTVAGSFASTAALDGVYWQIADSAGTLDMYFEFNVGTTGVPTTAVWTGGLTTAVNTLKVFAFNWAGSSWDQVGTLNGLASLIVSEQQYDFTTAHVGTGGNLGLVRLRFQNTGLTAANFYTDQVLCGYTNVLTAAQIATGVWQDTTAGDFTVASSIGKSLFTSGNAPGAASGLALVGSNMGAVSSVTGNVGGSVGSVTAGVTVTTNNDKTGYSLSQAFPTNFAALAISGAGHISNVDTLTTYTGNTVQTADVATVKTQTDKLAFTVANQVDANPLSMNGSATAAANIGKAAANIGRGTAAAGGTTTSIPTSAFSPGGAGIVSGQFIGRIIIFDGDTTTAALRGQATSISANTSGATPTFTVVALTTAPASGDTFSVQ